MFRPQVSHAAFSLPLFLLSQISVGNEELLFPSPETYPRFLIKLTPHAGEHVHKHGMPQPPNNLQWRSCHSQAPAIHKALLNHLSISLP